VNPKLEPVVGLSVQLAERIAAFLLSLFIDDSKPTVFLLHADSASKDASFFMLEFVDKPHCAFCATCHQDDEGV